MNNLKISKNGLLYNTTFNSKTKKNEIEEVSEQMSAYLFDICEIDKDVSMRDIFLLCKKNINILTIIIKNWIDEWVGYGLSLPKVEKNGTTYDDIEFMELHWNAEVYDGKVCGTEFPEFHCVGYEAKEDICEHGYKVVEKGERMNYGISEIDHLIDVPLKLDYTFHIYDEEYKLVFISKKDYRLFDIIYGIIWEISFHGGPDMVKKLWTDIFDEIKTFEK